MFLRVFCSFFFLFFSVKFNLDSIKKAAKKVQDVITKSKKSGEDATEPLQELKELNIKAAELQHSEKEIKSTLDTEMSNIGNLVHPSVPVSQDEVSVSQAIQVKKCSDSGK